MNNLAEKRRPLQPWLEYGIVETGAANTFIVRTSLGNMETEVAAGCLLCPQPGDEVLFSTDAAGTAFILSVLKRADHRIGKSKLIFQGDVDLCVANGSMNIAADQHIFLTARQRMAMTSTEIAMQAKRGKAAFEKLSYLGRKFKGRVQRLSLVAQTAVNTFQRFTQRLHNAFRFVEDYEEIQTGSTRYLVEDTLTMHTKNAVHMAEEVVTINAEQVHLG
jgi:hypothetical protein